MAMNPYRVRYFLAVVEEMHFGRAADRLRIAQPALSQQIKRLEQELGVALFDRTRRRVELTEAGRTLAEDGRRLLDHHEKVQDATRAAGRGEIGTLRVGMVGSAVIGLLPELMSAFTRDYPNARLEFTEMPSGLHHVDAIREHRIDVGLIRYPPPPADDVALEPLLEEPLIAVLPADHRLANLQHIPASALSEEPFVLWPRWRSPRLYDGIFSADGSLGFAPRIAQEANGVQTNLALVAAGVGVSLLPASVRVLTRTGVVFRALTEPAPTSTLAAAWHQANRAPLLDSFLHVVRKILKHDDRSAVRQ